MIECVWFQRIGSESTHDLPAFCQRTAKAGVDVIERMRIGLQKAIEWIRERGVDWKTHRLSRVQDDVKPWMIAAIETTRQRFGNQPSGRQRNQVGTFQTQQTCGIAWNQL